MYPPAGTQRLGRNYVNNAKICNTTTSESEYFNKLTLNGTGVLVSATPKRSQKVSNALVGIDRRVRFFGNSLDRLLINRNHTITSRELASYNDVALTKTTMFSELSMTLEEIFAAYKPLVRESSSKLYKNTAISVSTIANSDGSPLNPILLSIFLNN